jgi:hypothetical protein
MKRINTPSRDILRREVVILILDYKKNLGTLDRIIRTAIGIYTLWLVITGTVAGWWAVAALVFAIFNFIEAAIAY